MLRAALRHGVLNQVFEAALTFLINGCEVMRRVGVKNGFIIACAHMWNIFQPSLTIWHALTQAVSCRVYVVFE